MASTTRVTSLMSGMDTDALVEEMLSAARLPLDNYEKDKTTVQWQRETLLELNSEMLAFQNSAFDMRLESTYKKYTANSTNSLVAKAIAGTSAMEGTYTVKSTQLAAATTITSGEMDTDITGSYFAHRTNLSGTSMKVTLNGVTKTISFGEDEGDFSGYGSNQGSEVKVKLEELLEKKINNAFGSEQIEVTVGSMSNDRRLNVTFTSKSELNHSLVIEAGEDGANTLDKLGFVNKDKLSNVFSTDVTVKEYIGEDALDANGNFSLTINGKKLEFSGDRTLNEVFKTISDDEDLDINIKYDKVANSVIMKRDSTGAGRDIEISDEHGFFSSLKLTNDTGATYAQGKNAIVTLTDPEGRKIEGIQMTSNSFEYEGVSFTLLKTNPEEEVAITVAKDTEAIYESVVGFVDKYNSLLGKLNQLYNEERYKDYEPLTDAEREALSDTQQEKWDKLAKSGILRRDSTLQSAIADMRNAVTSVMNSTGINSIFELGITTTAYSSTGSDNGKLIIDEEKLKEAINNDINAVSDFFTSTPTNITGTSLEANPSLALNGKSMSVTVGSKTHTITFDKDYDISNSDSKDELLEFINSELKSAFGKDNVSVSMSSNRIVVNSLMKNTVTVNAGSTGNDALEVLKLDDGATYDSTKIGFASKIYNIMDRAMDAIKDKAGSSSTSIDDSTLGQKMSRLNSYISKQEDKLALLEERYYAQFAAMESALAQLDAQSSQLMNMLGSN